ncbi:sensor domain-containing diguanylate cyclase [Parathalassolituus penaei]|uniref:diguanylate cyclase n=1 Tax=Parathalassolituus penaei TaxID=2997323 RepID=A0A9X3IS71_9GAMM|nr:diguanylate cyclase [Parathalassolituus penaei]MCY0963848.1 diguanylate cyclase [Parathalassolituus penaei]
MVLTIRAWLPLVCLLALFFPNISLAESAVGSTTPLIIIDRNSPVTTPDNRIRYLVEEQALNIGQVLENDLEWQILKQAPLNLPNEERPVWVHFRLMSKDGTPQKILHIDWSLLRQLEVYLFDRTDWKLLQYERVQLGQASGLGARLPFYLNLDTPLGHQTDVLIRVQASEHLLMPIQIFSPSSYVEHKQNRYLAYGMFFGLLLAMLGYNLSLYIFVRDKNYAVYCLYVAAITGYSATMNGIGPAWVWGGSDWLTNHAFRVFSSLSFITAALFIRQFLNLRQHGGWPWYLSNVSIITWFVLLLITPFSHSDLIGRAHSLSALISPVIAFIITLPLLLKRDEQAQNLSIAWLPLLVATFYYMLHLLGWLPYSTHVLDLQRFSFAIEVLLLSIALAQRINRERKERVLAQEASLRYYRQASKARQGELAAREAMLEAERKARSELEQRVAERTHELQSALASLATLNKELEAQSRTDGLTQLTNRRYFDDSLIRELHRAVQQQTPLALLIGDLDHFKHLNDHYGHLAGDECLRIAARLWRQQARRPNEVAARYGGEEFVMLLPEVDSTEALWLAERIRESIEELRINHDGHCIQFTCSIGVCAIIPNRQTTPESLLAAADAALYEAKASGRNKVCQGQWRAELHSAP